MMGNVNKTDELDARGLAILLWNGTLPTVSIAPIFSPNCADLGAAGDQAHSLLGEGDNNRHRCGDKSCSSKSIPSPKLK